MLLFSTNKKAVFLLGIVCAVLISALVKQNNFIFDVMDANHQYDRNDLYRDAPQPLEEIRKPKKTPVVTTKQNMQDFLEQRQKRRKALLEESSSKTKNKKPKKRHYKPLNIILFYADDWRFDTLGAAGNAVVKTPVLDRMAAEGVRFTENCVTTSICWISRATLYTGMYLARHKFEMLGAGRTVDGQPMGWEPLKNETIYALLKHHAGYHVGHAGKLGLWTDIDNHKNMDYFVNEDTWHYQEINGKLWHITEKNTHDAMNFLRARPRTKPFFLNVGYFATHAVDNNPLQYQPQNTSMSMYANDTIPIPLTADAYGKMPYFFGPFNEGRSRWKWRFDKPDKHQTMMKNYYRMATEVDTSVGTLLKELEKQGVLNHTLIIFTTDNGNFHAEHGLADKWYPHQESIKVPLIIKDPRMDPEYVGTTNDDFTLNIDLAPTILKAAGLEPLSTMMGRDMSDLYRKEKNAEGRYLHARERRYLENNNPSSSNSKYHTGNSSNWRTEFFYHHPMHTDRDFIPASEALVRKDYKYMYWPDFDYEELFDLRNDPGEVHDLLKQSKKNKGSEWVAGDDVTDQVRDILEEMRERFKDLKDWAHSDEEAIIL